MNRPNLSSKIGANGPLRSARSTDRRRDKTLVFALALLVALIFHFYGKGLWRNEIREQIPPLYPRAEPALKREPKWEPTLLLRNAEGVETRVRLEPDLPRKAEASARFAK